MQKALGEAGLRLERMTEGVPKIEQRASAGGFAFVLGRSWLRSWYWWQARQSERMPLD